MCIRDRLGANHPMGPLALGDMIGLDIVLAIMEVLESETGDPKYRPHTPVSYTHLGLAHGVGFGTFCVGTEKLREKRSIIGIDEGIQRTGEYVHQQHIGKNSASA